jgi:hypothetical protein
MITTVNWSNVTSMDQLPATANSVSGGAFWTSILYMVWVIVLLVSMTWGFEIALIASSFICLVLGIFLVYAGLVAWQWCMTFAAILLFTFLYITWTTRQHNY